MIRRGARAALLCVALVAAALGVVAFAAPSRGAHQQTTAASAGSAADGRRLFVESCSSCHGLDARGVHGRGPSLIGAGALAADFYLRTGRMPLADPHDVPVRAPVQFGDREIRDLVAYVGSLGGPPIPAVDAAGGDLARGRKLFESNCAGCHQIMAQGGIVTGGVAPALQDASPLDVAEAVRVGPYLMPPFATAQLDARDVNDLARYVEWARHPDNRGGWAIGNLGPIPEGMVAWLVAIVALIARRDARRRAEDVVSLLGRLLAALAIWRRGLRRLGEPVPSSPREVDPRKRTVPCDAAAEMFVAALLFAAAAAAIAFVVLYVVDDDTQLLGLSGGLALALVAAALLIASLRVVPQVTAAEPRPELRGDDPLDRDDPEAEEVADELRSGAEGISRRRLLLMAGGAAGAAVGAAALTPLASLGPSPGAALAASPWRRGVRLVGADGTALRADAIAVGGFETAFPEGADKRELASPVVLVRLSPAALELPPARRSWAPLGVVAYSKICTHAGCAVSLLRSPKYQPTSKSPGAGLPVPLLHVRSGARRGGHVRPRGTAAASAPADARRQGDAAGRGTAVGTGRPRLVGSRRIVSRSRADTRCDPLATPVQFVDERLGAARTLRGAMRYVFPDHWSFLLGEIALYAFIALIVTGTYLALFFTPSTSETIYRGGYAPLQGATVSEAYASTLRISFDIPAGLLIRQTHHWAALVFVAAIVVHLMRIFFTGAFRKPRELNYMIGVTMLMLAVLEGFLGYSLPDDLLSGMGLAIAYGVAMSIPLLGGQIATLLWDGRFPGSSAFEPRLFIGHVFVLPAILGTLIAVHLAMVIRQRHTQFPGPGRTERNDVGTPMWPGYALRSTGWLFAVLAVLVLLGGLVQINPIWQWGPYEPWQGTNGAQPDWYLGWLIGALRLMPAIEPRFWGHTWVPNPFFGGVLFPLVVFGVLYSWPWLEQRFLTRDRRRHELLDRPRDNPWRTAVGVAFLTWVFAIFAAGSADRLLVSVGFPYESQVWFFRIAALVLPFVAGAIALRICRELRGERAAIDTRMAGRTTT